MKELAIYIHIPFCVRKCAYCDFLSFPAKEEQREEYLKALLQEIRQKGQIYRDYRVSTIFFGGGTPSSLQEGQIAKLMEALRDNFAFAEDAEISIECNPGTLTSEKLKEYRDCGFNRLSIGLQSAENEELRALGRIHTWEEFLEGFSLAKEAGFTNLNIDLISSLPGQSTDSFAATLRRVIALKPTHISVYSLIIEPGTPFYDLYEEDILRREKGKETRFLPDEDTEYAIGKNTRQFLRENGYEHYEISNYALPGYRCRHNVGYWTGAEYIGLGLGASSYINKERRVNSSDLRDYITACEKGEDPCREIVATDEKARMEEFMFLGLRMTEGVSLAEFERCFGMPLKAAYPQETARLQQEKLLVLTEESAYLTEEGLDLANYCMAMFLKEKES